MKETKQTLIKVESGTVDLVLIEDKDATVMTLQFNSSCMDALPYCQALCCRIHNHFSVELTEKEAKTIGGYRILNTQAGEQLLVPTKASPKSSECQFLTQENLCSIQNKKPQNCTNWHCSPGGIGENIAIRYHGWMLLPTQIQGAQK